MKKNIDVNYEKILMDSGMPTTDQAVRAQFEILVKQEGLITNTSRMSPFWRLITAIVTTPFLWLKDALINTVLKNSFLATATGPFLDLFAWAVNIERKAALAASGVIHFYKTDDKQPITIKAGTIVQSERIDGVIYQLRVTNDIIIPAGVSALAVPVEAVSSGAGYNLAPGYYRILPQSVPGISYCANEENWLTQPGAEQESDGDLRPRIRNQYNLVSNYHTDAVYRGMISSIVGLNSERVYFVHDAPRGPGTADVYLLLDTGVISQPFVDAINDYVMAQGHHGHGDDLRCFALPETHHDLSVSLYLDHELEGEEQARLIDNVAHLIRCAFRENNQFNVVKVWPYSRYSFSQLGREIHRHFGVDSVVFSIGDITSGLAIPRLNNLTVSVDHG
ncbi:baseplate J/gp47 family protein [Pragia fontium]|uniref:Baseplate J-like protein n=1 Tax=Pragia fontium DSM 5563 = ATCC 49100 TaxID=1122977 RepID=A0AAJ4W9G9_9GAMM|nr:baseplate J/gp47 family protein [Pragia fontium]SFC50028.1 Baseplate J-like protein [Pragia fontium DSM 5563 = ATCC 49100]